MVVPMCRGFSCRLSITIDIIFWLDILLTFHTGFDKGFIVVMDKGSIILKYLKGKIIPSGTSQSLMHHCNCCDLVISCAHLVRC